jgi:hypothetical protein
MAGNASVGGDLNVTSKALTYDYSNAFATASGLDLERYQSKFGSSITDILNGNAFHLKRGTQISGNVKKDSGDNGAAPSAGDKIDTALGVTEDEGAPAGAASQDSVSSKALAGADAKTDENSVNSGSTGTYGSVNEDR